MNDSRYATWPEDYASKLMEPAEAAALVRPGDTIVIPIGSITPNLCHAIWDRREELSDIDILSCAPFVDPGWYEPGHPAFRTHVELFNTAIARQSMLRGETDFVSVPFSRRFKPEDERGGGVFGCDVALIGLAAGPFGFCSFGTSLWNKLSYGSGRGRCWPSVPGYPQTADQPDPRLGDRRVRGWRRDAPTRMARDSTVPEGDRGVHQ